MGDRVHVVGAGLAGLSAAVRLTGAGVRVCLSEAGAQAGGRCRSYYDRRLDAVIDNGNHLLLAANRETLAYLEAVGAADALVPAADAALPFLDLGSGKRWSVAPDPGPVPFSLLRRRNRIPGARLADYLRGLALVRAGNDATVADCVGRGPLYDRLWRPLTVAVLNTDPEEASARLLWSVLRMTWLKGAAACRPQLVRQDLAAALVAPALRFLGERGTEIRFNTRLRAFAIEDGRVTGLDFTTGRVSVGGAEHVILCVPAPVAAGLVPGLRAPVEARPIVNGHVRVGPDAALPDGGPVLGLIGGTADWVFLRHGIASLTVSAATALVDRDATSIADAFRDDLARVFGTRPAGEMRIIKERRATMAQTPAALRLRPAPATPWPNLLLAGDYTDTGLPATIEGAVLSGRRAAALVMVAESRAAGPAAA